MHYVFIQEVNTDDNPYFDSQTTTHGRKQKIFNPQYRSLLWWSCDQNLQCLIWKLLWQHLLWQYRKESRRPKEVFLLTINYVLKYIHFHFKKYWTVLTRYFNYSIWWVGTDYGLSYIVYGIHRYEGYTKYYLRRLKWKNKSNCDRTFSSALRNSCFIFMYIHTYACVFGIREAGAQSASDEVGDEKRRTRRRRREKWVE